MRKNQSSLRKPGGSRNESRERGFSKSTSRSAPKKSFKSDSERPKRSESDDSFRKEKPRPRKPLKTSDKPFSRSRRDSEENKTYEKNISESRSSDRKPFEKRESSWRDKKPFGRKSSSESGERKSYGEKRSYGDKKPFERRGDSDFSERKSYGERRSYGDKKPFERRGDSDSGERKSFGEKRTYGEKKSFGEKKPYGEKKQFGERKPFRENKSFERKNNSGFGEGDRKPYERRSSSDDKRPFERKYPKKEETGFNDEWNQSLDAALGNDAAEFRKAEKSDRPLAKRSSASKFERKEKHEFYGDKKKYESKSFNKPVRERNTIDREEKFSESNDEFTVRLNKYISNAGVCSRREADDLIQAGVVRVNGEIITTLGYKVKPGDVVNYGGQTLKNEKLVYLLLNKPKDYITTMDDPQNRNTVMSLIAGACRERIYPVGRLDRNTSGLLLFTNDGELADRLMHPSFEAKKIYHVELDKNLKPDHFKALVEGIELEDGEAKVDDIAFIGDGFDKRQVGLELHSGRNRIVRRMFEHFGYVVKKLDRTYYAGLGKKDLPRGRHRFLTSAEVGHLKMITAKKKQK